ncbi:MAG: Maf-like protein [Gammaproteobacteria bacterium]|nr:Maf-like protein [Gammaproteobacteria bacterium]
MASNFDIYLASSSPRRRELLDQIAVTYRVIKQDVPENVLAGESPHDYVQRLALEKARAGWCAVREQDARPVLGADTTVVINGRIMGKPLDKEDGLAMLELLSDACHQVYSAVALVSGQQELTRVNCSQVCFRKLTEAEKLAYWNTGEPADKAGGYGIQGRAAIFITKLEGSYSGVVGLPLYETAELLREMNLIAL